MRFYERQIQLHQYMLQGLLQGLLPLVMLASSTAISPLPEYMSMAAGIAAFLLHIIGISMIFRYPLCGKLFSLGGALLCTLTIWYDLAANPLLALFYAVLSIGTLYYLFTTRLFPAIMITSQLQLERFCGSCWALLIITVLSPLLIYTFSFFAVCAVVCTVITLYQLNSYLKLRGYFQHPVLVKLGLFFTVAATAGVSWFVSGVLASLLVALPALIFAIRQKHSDLEYLQLVIRHPARCLILTFLLLGIAGTLALRTPAAMQGELSVVDTAFTAVSGCCVTGLSVIDIASELTLTGRIFLLILIQLGGLGIMTLTTLALHALGRVSLGQEQLAMEISGSHEQDIYKNLRLIVSFTLVVEFIGACFLTWGFYSVHHSWAMAAEYGIFTSVSAFCNAGFFPGANGLAPYTGEYLLLTVIAIEIILGGIAPAITWTVLCMRSHRRLPFICRMVLYVTGILLTAGTLLLLLLEWNGIFAELSAPGKLVNAFFLSASARTAGFSTVSLGGINMQSFMIIVFLMFVGGSPGGSAGGVKTTTIAVLFFTFSAALRNRETVTAGGWKIAHRTVIQAVAIVMAALMILFLTMLMLTATQDISAGKLFFEAVSALSTTGLSLNATGLLDAVGKVIIITAMFIGRVGPLTMFLLFSDRRVSKQPGYPPVNIPLG